MAIVLSDAGETTVQTDDNLWVSPADAERATGWAWKPEGMCRNDLCVPLPTGAFRNGRIDLAAFWQTLDRPILHDPDSNVWMLGAGADERNRALAGSIAPDFTLPDLNGSPHRLGDLRGKKVLLCTWASW